MCGAATSPPVPFHPPFTHCVPPVIHPPYEWKTETEGNGAPLRKGGERYTPRIKPLHPAETRNPIHLLYKRTEEKLVMFVPDPNPPPASLIKTENDSGDLHQNPTAHPQHRRRLRLTTTLSDEQKEAKCMVMLCPQQLYAGCVYIFSRSSPDTLRAALALRKALNSQPRTHTYLEVQPEVPKTNAHGRCGGVYLLCSLDFESKCPRGNFLRACSTPDCLKKPGNMS